MANNCVFDRLTGLWIPSEIMKIKNLTAVQKMIMGLAASFRNGLKLSNSQLATLLGIDRRNVIHNIQKLRKNGYLEDVGRGKQHRVLKVSGAELSLLDSDKTPPVRPSSSDVNGKKHPKVVMPASPISNNLNKEKEKGKTYTQTSDEVRLSKLLFDLIKERHPQYPEPDFQKWAIHIDRLLSIEKKTPAEIEKVIRWCQADDFWQDNCLSTASFRKKNEEGVMRIVKLEMQMVKESPQSHIPPLVRDSEGLTPRQRMLAKVEK